MATTMDDVNWEAWVTAEQDQTDNLSYERLIYEAHHLWDSIEHLRFSAVRLAIAQGIGTCRLSTVQERSPKLLEQVLQGITPPYGHRFWGGRGKPGSLTLTLKRMADEGLVELITKEVGDRGRTNVLGAKLLPAGCAYAVRHGAELTAEDLIAYMTNQGDWPPDNTNKNLQQTGAPDQVDPDDLLRYSGGPTHDWNWLLAVAKGDDSATYDYESQRQSVSLPNLITAVRGHDAKTCFQYLTPSDRWQVVGAILQRAGSHNPELLDDAIETVLKQPTNAKRVARLITIYGAVFEHAEREVGNVICRTAWLRARAQLDRIAGTAPAQTKDRFGRIQDWKEPPRAIELDEFVNREREQLMAENAAGEMAANIIKRQYGEDAQGMSVLREYRTSSGEVADAVVLDAEGNVVAQIETKITRRPDGGTDISVTTTEDEPDPGDEPEAPTPRIY